MPAVAVIGGQWGDEGKGKIIDLLAEEADVAVRFSGGDNAGHTVINELGEFRLHLVPSGIFNPDCTCIIGAGAVINPEVLLRELDGLRAQQIDLDRLVISDRAHVVMPYHVLLDRLQEEARGVLAIGTTRKGIGPCYEDKVGRIGIRAGDLLDPTGLRERLAAVLEIKNRVLKGVYDVEAMRLDEVYDPLIAASERLAGYIRETTAIVDRAWRDGKKILLEGAQGSLLDTNYGTYPYVTSSSPLAANACLGSGLAPRRLDRVLGVFKAYTTRVGFGPMPSEQRNEVGDLIRERGQEYGTTTGRPRRCGWFDAVVGRFSARLNGYTGLAITRLDILDAFPTLRICTGYRIDGGVDDYLPTSLEVLERSEPIYEEMPGWQEPTSAARRYKELPAAARAYVERLSDLLETPIDIVSVGRERKETIICRDTFSG